MLQSARCQPEGASPCRPGEAQVGRYGVAGRVEADVVELGEGVVVAPNGNMYGAVNVAPHGITQYPKQSASKEKRS